MNIFEALDLMASGARLPFLVIGGHAVNAYGYSRFTKDLDILIRQTDRAAWIAALKGLNFTVEHDGGGFLQMNAPADCLWPLDLMIVGTETFESMRVGAKTFEVNGRKLLIPSLEHLFALKLHVLKQEIHGRGPKDLMDILTLAECNAVDLRSDRMRLLCEKYGSLKIYERLLAFKG